jgi:hypothetical protein
MKTIEINYGNSITVNRGNYENEKPMWHQKITFELNGETPEQIALLEETEFNRIKTAIDKRAQEAWDKAKQDLGNLRIRGKDGKKYPSYSSINHPDPLPIDPEFALRGTNVHTVINEWIKTGKWTKPEPLKKLKYDDIPYQKFFELYKDRIDFKDCKLNVEVFHDRLLYSGEIDCIGLVDKILTLIDFKTGSWDWMQLIAYYKAHNQVKQLAIFDLKNLELEILKFNDPKCQEKWENFLIKRGEFKARFGL